MEKMQTAAHCVTRVAENGGPMIFAQMGMMQAIHRHHERVINPDRKDTHIGGNAVVASRLSKPILSTAAMRQVRFDLCKSGGISGNSLRLVRLTDPC